MRRITAEEAREIAEEKGLYPGIVKDTELIHFTKGRNPKVNLITWQRFEKLLEERALAIYEQDGYMKIMKKS